MSLNEYAVRVRAVIIESFPRLLPYLKESDSGSLTITIPHSRIASGLLITTDGDEVSVGFRTWHTHGELLGGKTPEEHMHAAFAFVEQILDDEVPLVVSYVDGEFHDAWVSSDPTREEKYVQPNEQIRIGTWSGLAA
jgi:hypothetical protein